jgi:SpoVK/Ycf46/Vps4 family AAA+-type ATPase
VNPGDIARVRGEIAALAAAGGGLLDESELTRVVLEQSRHNLRAIAAEVKTPFTLDDIVVADEVRAQCLQLVALVERWGTLRDEWGLGRRVLTHRGISALFSGPPGTGKTMMAAILGRRLGLDVFRIDVAQIMSKWVGETEKNLARLFGEAARTRAVLVFDEADALFSRRVDVRQSVDRYSNAQVNYLLQRMESFEGILILTTNLERAVDEAFLRRIQFRVQFREPGAAEREQIWKKILPPEVALDGVDLRALAEDFPMTGGAIRNAAVRACLIAMTRGDDRKALTQAELARAIVDELGRDPRKKDDPRAGSRHTLLY